MGDASDRGVPLPGVAVVASGGVLMALVAGCSWSWEDALHAVEATPIAIRKAKRPSRVRLDGRGPMM